MFMLFEEMRYMETWDVWRTGHMKTHFGTCEDITESFFPYDRDIGYSCSLAGTTSVRLLRAK